MSSVRVLVGTKKGAFVLSAEAKRKDWTVSGPFFAGWEIYHLNCDSLLVPAASPPPRQRMKGRGSTSASVIILGPGRVAGKILGRFGRSFSSNA